MMEKIAFTYVMFLLKPIDIHQSLSLDDQLVQVRLVIEFLINTDNTIFILTVVKDFFRDLQQLKLFFNALEPFIEKKMLEEIPESFLDEFVQYYKELNKDMIQKVVVYYFMVVNITIEHKIS